MCSAAGTTYSAAGNVKLFKGAVTTVLDSSALHTRCVQHVMSGKYAVPT